ncbi:MAG: EamA family transporter, partial [Halioglobus sp.]|nr:EamA family transporter [Halioglobus sp.]
MTAVPERLLLIGAFAALYLIWGSTYLAIRFGVASWPPLLFTAVRFLLAGSLLYGWLRWRGIKPPTAQEWRSSTLLGVLMLGCGTGGV